jgi:release factor glutamine methyltransferase
MNESSKLPAQKIINDWLLGATTQLAAHSIPSPRLDAEVLLRHILGQTRPWVIAHTDYLLSPEQIGILDNLLNQRLQRIPIAYLTGHKEFYGRDFHVTPATLIPRPETETLIDLTLSAPGQSWSKEMRVLDVGTGSGCIGLTLKAERPDIWLTLSDISEEALTVAKKNASQLGISPVQYIQSNLLSHWLEHTEPQFFTVIIANLPYVDPTWERSPETDHEPSLALFADDKGLALIKELIVQSGQLLAVGGLLALEADPEQHEPIISYAQENGFHLCESREYAILLQRA